MDFKARVDFLPFNYPIVQEGDSPIRERSPIHREDSRRSTGYHSDGHHSSISSDNEDLSIRSDTTGINRNSKLV